MVAHLTPAEALDHPHPVCNVASCGERIWWNPRLREWRHYFEVDDHDATPL